MAEAGISVAEFGPWLGVVAAPRPRPTPGQLDLDPVRQALVQRLLEQAHTPDPDWLAAWHPVTDTVLELLSGDLHARATAAGQASLAPDKVVRSAQLDEEDRRILRARLASAAIPLEQVVAARAGSLGPRGFPAVGGAVEESWLTLEATVAAVAGEWAPRVAAVARWRRPLRRLWWATAIAVAAATVLGLLLGGYLPAPRWLEPLVTWWWSVPWP